jgi:macrolide transport system ATP-binding/permease protein
VGLDGRERNTRAPLSGGERQRVAIARALINSPAVVLADESTGNLDTGSSHEVMAILVRLNRERHVTGVVVTHETDIAADADRMITMRNGRILADERRAPLAEPAPAPVPQAPPWQTRGRTLPFTRMIVDGAIQAIGRNEMRSGLTTLGVLIGVAALIAIVAVGQGANRAVSELLRNLGTNKAGRAARREDRRGVRAGFGSASTLTVTDASALRRDDPAVARVGDMIRQSAQVQYRTRSWSTAILGTSANYAAITNWHTASEARLHCRRRELCGAGGGPRTGRLSGNGSSRTKTPSERPS